MQHGNEKVTQRNFLISDKFMQVPMLKTELTPTSKLDRVVFRAMGGVRMC